MRSAKNFVNVESVCLQKRASEERARDLEANESQIRRRCKAAFGELTDIESEFGADAAVRAFIIGNNRPVLALEIRKRDRRCRVCGIRMPNRVTHIMRKRPNRERVLVESASLAKKIVDEIARAGVMREVTEEFGTERIIAHVLDGAAAVCIRMRF